eukprot:2430522-Amphidinium_carterae.1
MIRVAPLSGGFDGSVSRNLHSKQGVIGVPKHPNRMRRSVTGGNFLMLCVKLKCLRLWKSWCFSSALPPSAMVA